MGKREPIHVHTTIELLDMAMGVQGIASDYKLALLLGVNASAVGHYRHGRSHPNDTVAEALARLCNLDRGYVVACVHASRAGESSSSGLWQYVASRLNANGIAAILVILSLGFWGGGPDGGALASTHRIAADPARGGLYIMLTAIRRFFTRSRCAFANLSRLTGCPA